MLQNKDCFGETPKPTRETRVLPYGFGGAAGSEFGTEYKWKRLQGAEVSLKSVRSITGRIEQNGAQLQCGIVGNTKFPIIRSCVLRFL